MTKAQKQYSQSPDEITKWQQGYFKLLIDDVMPLIKNLLGQKFIGWYCFLIQNKDNNALPEEITDNNLYVHLIFETPLTEKEIKSNLPSYCIATQKYKPSDKIAGIDNDTLKGQQIEEAWRMIGESSEWVLNLLSIHDITKLKSSNNILEFLHCICNQLSFNEKYVLQCLKF